MFDNPDGGPAAIDGKVAGDDAILPGAVRQVALRKTVSAPALQMLSLHAESTDVAVMGGFGLRLLVPAVYLFGRAE
jgi:hypothetical protein